MIVLMPGPFLVHTYFKLDECGVMQTSVAIDHSEMQLSEEEATSNISASSRFERVSLCIYV